MLTGLQRAKVREATLTFQVLVFLRLIMRRWANTQYAELKTYFPQQPIELSKKPHTVLICCPSTANWNCAVSSAMCEHQDRRLSLFIASEMAVGFC